MRVHARVGLGNRRFRRCYFGAKNITKENYHLLTETEGNSVFCGPETVDVSRGEAEGNIDGRGSAKHTAFPRSQSISVLLYINSQRNNKLKNK